MSELTDMRTVTALIARVVDAPSSVIVLETTHADELVDGLRMAARHSGQALYLWTEDSGLRSLREGGMATKVSGGLADTLRFVRSSNHFGIYLLRVDAAMLSESNVSALVRIARLRDQPSWRVVLLGNCQALAARLAAVSLRLRIAGDEGGRPRLRDGRWVQ